jgi:hypothetical protein
MPLNVQIRRVRARDVREQPVNARYMAKSEYDALVANIRRDGVLTSTPLLYQPGGTGPIDVVSGHHRNRATLEALGDDAEYDAMVILDEQSRDEIIARQISHNSIARAAARATGWRPGSCTTRPSTRSPRRTPRGGSGTSRPP